MPDHIIKTETFKQVKQGQLWWNTVYPICLAKAKVISSSSRPPPSLITIPLPPHQQIKTRQPDINWKRRSKMFEMSEPEIPFWAESHALQAVVQVTNCHFWYVLLNIIGWEAFHKRCIFHLSATPPALFHAQPSGICRILINQDKNHPKCCFWILPTHWGVICYVRWPLTSPVFLLKYPKIKEKRLSEWSCSAFFRYSAQYKLQTVQLWIMEYLYIWNIFLLSKIKLMPGLVW